MAFSPEKNAANSEIIRYDLGWDAINSMLRAGRSLSGRERNCCFLNSGGQRFADVSGVTGLDYADDGRVLALSDWDYDGDVDFWVANRSGPQVRFLQNNLKRGQAFVAVKLEGVASNRDGIGARVVIESTVNGKPVTQTQTLKAGEGYLAQNSKWLHFGLGNATQINALRVTWPSGKTDSIDTLGPNSWYTVKEGTATATPWTPPTLKPRTPSEFNAPTISDKARIVLLNPIPLPPINYSTQDGEQRSATQPGEKAKLVNLWATWCQPCLEELSEWKSIADELQTNGVEVLAINTDEESDDRASKVSATVERLVVPFQIGIGDEQLVAQFDTIQRSLLSRQRPLPLPSSFLIDSEGRLRVVYKGPVSAEQLLADASLVDAQPQQILDAAIPFEGRWMMPPGGSTPLHLTVKYIDNDLAATAKDYIESLLAQRQKHPEYINASMTNLYAAMLLDAQEFDAARRAFETSLEIDPNDRQAHIELGTLLLRGRRGTAAEPHFKEVLRITPNDPELVYGLAMSQMQQGKFVEAKEGLETSIKLQPSSNAYWQLGTLAIQMRDVRGSITAYEAAIKISPDRAKQANNLAWLLATTDDSSLRNGNRAVEIARLIVAGRANDPSAMDTLAAALAEQGNFAEAIRIATQAIEISRGSGNEKLATKIKSRLDGYKANKPHRDSLK